MKILTPQENSDIKAINQTREILRTQSIEKAADSARKSLSKANIDFNESMAAFKERWAIEEQEHAKRVSQMQKEVALLEERKKIALLPVALYKEQAHTMIQQAQKYLEDAKAQEHNVDLLRDLLENKLDDVGDREQKLRAKELRLSLREQGIIAQENQLKEHIKRMKGL